MSAELLRVCHKHTLIEIEDITGEAFFRRTDIGGACELCPYLREQEAGRRHLADIYDRGDP